MHITIRACFLCFFYNPYMSLFNSKNFSFTCLPSFFYWFETKLIACLLLLLGENTIRRHMYAVLTKYVPPFCTSPNCSTDSYTVLNRPRSRGATQRARGVRLLGRGSARLYRSYIGCIQSLDWNTGLDYWTGLLDSAVLHFTHAQYVWCNTWLCNCAITGACICLFLCALARS